MSLLLIDVGNTRIKWAVASGGDPGTPGTIVHRDRPPGAALQELLAAVGAAGEPEEIRVANVAGPGMRAALQPALESRFRAPQRWAKSAGAADGLRNAYHDPSQLGVDRWLALCAAWRSGRNLCLVAAGTALTIDLVSDSGLHAGGLIIPGFAAMQSAVLAAAPDLGRVAARSARTGVPRGEELGRDTRSALELGALRAATALVDECRSSFGARGDIDVVLTGGDAERLRDALAPRLAVTLRRQLVLEGLARTPACFDVET